MARMTSKKRRRRRGVSRRKRYVPPESLKKVQLDANLELSVSNFARQRQYTVLSKKPDGVESFFMKTHNYKMHELAQKDYRERYIAGLLVLVYNKYNVEMDPLFFGLAAALARHDNDLIQAFLDCRRLITPRIVLKALTTLDLGRRLRAIEKRVKRLQLTKTRINKSQIPNQGDMKRLSKVMPQNGTASGAICKHITRWAKSHSKEELLGYVDADSKRSSSDCWKKLADICHFNPKKDFASLPWFLPYCFGQSRPVETPVKLDVAMEESASKPEDAAVPYLLHLSSETPTSWSDDEELRALTVNQRVLEANVPFSAVQKAGLMLCLTPEAKAHMAMYSDLRELLQNFDEILCQETDMLISGRLMTEGDELFQPVDKVKPILQLLQHVVQACSKERSGEYVYKMNEQGEFVQEYKEADPDLGQATLGAFEIVLEKWRLVMRDVLAAAKVDLSGGLVIVDSLSEDVRSPPPDYVLVGATLAMLLDAKLWMGEYRSPPPSAVDVLALGKLYCTSEQHFKRGYTKHFIQQLYDDRTKVPVIALVMDDQSLYQNGNEEVDSLMVVLNKYSEEVHRSFFLLLAYQVYTSHPLVVAFKSSKLNYLVYCHHRVEKDNEDETLDNIVKLLASPITSLKSLEDQTEDVVQAIKRDGVKSVFKAMVD